MRTSTMSERSTAGAGPVHPDPSLRPARGEGGVVVASALAGALIGAAGLGWWLLAEAERRRQRGRQERNLRLSRLQGGSGLADPTRADAPPLAEGDLHRKVHELNQAIEAVRRQLEQLQPPS